MDSLIWSGVRKSNRSSTLQQKMALLYSQRNLLKAPITAALTPLVLLRYPSSTAPRHSPSPLSSSFLRIRVKMGGDTCRCHTLLPHSGTCCLSRFLLPAALRQSPPNPQGYSRIFPDRYISCVSLTCLSAPQKEPADKVNLVRSL